MLVMTKPAASDRPLEQHEPLPAETNFYSAYDWSLDPHRTVGEAIERLVGEIDRLAATPAGWQNPRSHDERVSGVAQRTYVAAARAFGENPRGAYRFVGDGDGYRKSPKAVSHAGLSLEGAVAGLSGRLFRHPGAMRMRSSVVRGIDREFICNAAIAAPVRLAGLEPLRAVRVQSAGYDLFRRAGARTAIPGAIPRQIVPGFFCSGAYGRHLFFCTAALLICRGKIIPLSPGLHQLRRGLQFPGR